MKYAHYQHTDAEGVQSEGVCHKSRLEYLATPGSVMSIDMVDDEQYAKLVDSYGGVETAPAAKAKPKKNAKKEGDELV